MSPTHDNIRKTSGQEIPRADLPITFDHKCLSHQNPGPDTQFTLKMFKMACLAYKPSDINYRNMVIDRPRMIQLRRGMIDKLTSVLQSSDIFQ